MEKNTHTPFKNVDCFKLNSLHFAILSQTQMRLENIYFMSSLIYSTYRNNNSINRVELLYLGE